MKKRFILFSMLGLLMSGVTYAQQNHWKSVNEAQFRGVELVERLSTPLEYKLFSLNTDNLLSELQTIHGKNINKIISLPNEDGTFTQYNVREASIMHPDLQAKHQNIRSYSGKSIDGQANIRFSYSPYFGLSAIIFRANGTTSYLDAYTADLNTYITYERSTIENKLTDFTCHADHDFENQIIEQSIANAQNRDMTVVDGKLRKYRLALASTIEYSAFHIGRANAQNESTAVKKEVVLAAMNVAMTRVNGIYENEVGVTMELIPNNTDIIFIDSDNYTNNNGYTMLSENQTTIDQVIGKDNYDIGHVFSTGGGGIARLQSPCNDGVKAMGVTGLGAPVNDAFYVDFVAHEMGHQYGAPHTFNNSCSGNRSGGTSVEPGSGSTIMAYAGICPPNVQRNSDPYFHTVSVSNIYNFIRNGGTCSVDTNTNNSAPTISSNKSMYFIPHSTAFVLNATAEDADGDSLTYNWEQTDAQISTQPPLSTSTSGPNFRSLPPEEVSYRYFPNLKSIVDGKLVFTSNPDSSRQNSWEVIASVKRDYNFSLLVRDNNPIGGQTARKNFLVRVQDVGPFKVTSQATAEVWDAQENPQATITWDVAGTDANSINATEVDIFLSLDGGKTFDKEIAKNVPNTGSYTFNIPAGSDTTKARIMVKASDNIFLAVNSANFTIKNASMGVNDASLQKSTHISPNPSNGVFEVKTAKNAKLVSVEIHDATGRKVFENLNPKNIRFDVTKLTNGVYLVTVKTDKGTETQKLIIKK
ncbi:Por secretion system C-terminal sorting domain [Weeksella virosa]|uniref:reprolysin-like metallopeptidase n=1 Tax=Weeksella virosa TaxID=1014 RepID=UPI000E03B523|nr:zinc-dependent metalloprotease family protein [Weeksella virosa]SUP53560.1 Por secretion system C-terminal sorting domain [Weeksella virosa]